MRLLEQTGNEGRDEMGPPVDQYESQGAGWNLDDDDEVMLNVFRCQLTY